MHGGSGAWVANLTVGFNLQFGHSGGSGASFGGCLAKVAFHPHVFIFFWPKWLFSTSIQTLISKVFVKTFC
jgi:hypothetical protein